MSHALALLTVTATVTSTTTLPTTLDATPTPAGTPTAAAGSGGPTTVRAQPPLVPSLANTVIFARLGAVIVSDPGFDLFSKTGGMAAGQIGAGWVPPWLAGAMQLDLALVFAGSGASAFDVVDTGLFSVGLEAGASLGWRPIDYLHLYGRGAVSISNVSVRLSVAEDAVRLTDSGPVVGGDLIGGLELVLPLEVPRGRAVDRDQIAFGVEAGWRAATSLSLSGLARDLDEDTDPSRIRLGATDLGAVDLSGPTIRAVGTLRF